MSALYTSLPCFDLKGITSEKDGQRSILKFCKWNGLALPCSAIFSTFPTERGMCCSFNMKAAKDIFRGETYSKLIQDLQQSDKINSFELCGLKLTRFRNLCCKYPWPFILSHIFSC